MTVIKVKLTDEQKALFGETCMGHFLDVKNVTLSRQIFHNMIIRQVYYEDSSSDGEVINIDLCGIVVPFTKVHLAVISGLKVHGETNVYVVKLSDNIRGKYFSSHKDDEKKCPKILNWSTTKEKKLIRKEIQEEVFLNPDCVITEIKPSEEELSDIRTRDLIAIEKASLKRKLVFQKESEAPHDKDNEVIEVRNIHLSKCQKVKLGTTVMECDFREAMLKHFEDVKGEIDHVKEELQGVHAQQFNSLQMMCILIDMV
ncbi:hypothetical protein PanWU01x14_018470 [Parasponia andersonii]|uniref:Uncharacterized protein n=1 Tax=Parasponia andersonii TaxID=3476 RepID=A0A2P5DZ64_PARAD|nr:hypothetical protein PanWU01x14_018470 [Parasponia andersonii]